MEEGTTNMPDGELPETSAAEAAPALSASNADGWYILDENGQHMGPYDAQTMEGYAAYGSILPSTLAWREGRSEWLPIAQLEELASVATAAEGYLAAVDQPVHIPNFSSGDGEVTAASEVQAEPGEGRDEALAEFQAEMDVLGALDADAEPISEPDEERAATPDPEDQRFEDDDGTIYIWDHALRKFVEEGSEAGAALAAAQQQGYNVDEMTFEMDEEAIPAYNPPADDDDEEEEVAEFLPLSAKKNGKEALSNGEVPSAADGQPLNGKGKGKGKGKRTAEDVVEKHKEKARKAKEAAEKEQSWFDMKVNTSVYVTGLPSDVTEGELAQVFSKCGILKLADDKRPKVKVYRDKESGFPKGDGLVTYMKEPSVVLALQILDGAPFRPELSKPMTVQRAKFEMHGEQFVPKKRPNKKKKKAAVAAERMLGWDGFDDLKKPTEVTVILENLFHPDQFLEDPNLRGDLEADVRSECNKLGPVDKVRIFHQNPNGVISVRFKLEDGAALCVERMNGRFFGGRQVLAHMWDGFTNYNIKVKETEEEERARLDRYAKEIAEQELDPKLAERLRQDAEKTAAEAQMVLG
eukprot:jgi/Botrbrau1/19417/Bobra.0338s0044.1